MADTHYHGNSCQSLGWARMSQQKWGLFVQISFLAVHEKSTGSNPDAMLALQKQSSSVTLLLTTTIAGQWWDRAEDKSTSENTGSGTAWKHNYCITKHKPVKAPTQSDAIQYPNNKYYLCDDNVFRALSNLTIFSDARISVIKLIIDTILCITQQKESYNSCHIWSNLVNVPSVFPYIKYETSKSIIQLPFLVFSSNPRDRIFKARILENPPIVSCSKLLSKEQRVVLWFPKTETNQQTIVTRLH